MSDRCRRCGQLLSQRFISKGWKYCEVCNQQWIDDKSNSNDKFSQEIREDYKETIKGLRETVSHSRQGMPRKQQWGTHIINPIKVFFRT